MVDPLTTESLIGYESEPGESPVEDQVDTARLEQAPRLSMDTLPAASESARRSTSGTS